MKLFLKFIWIKGILPIVVMFTLPIWILPMGILWLLFKIWESWEEYKSWDEWEKMAITNNRIGLVRISTNLIKREPEVVAEAIKGSVILKAEWQEWTDQLVYVLWNADLPEIPFGASPPEYSILYDSKLKKRVRFQPVTEQITPEVEKLFLKSK